MNSRLPRFYQLSHSNRLDALLEACPSLTQADLDQLTQAGQLGWERADKMVENCIGVFELPVGLGLNFVINDQEHLIPMAVEEPSIIAAVSHIARLVRPFGGFKAEADPSIMIAQIQLVGCPNQEQTQEIILEAKDELIKIANQCHPNLQQRGGGALDLEVRQLPAHDDQAHEGQNMCIVHLLVDCVDAMGANAVNTMAERLAPHLEELTQGKVYLRILSNLADRRLARASFKLPETALHTNAMSGPDLAQGIVLAYQFADLDPYRAATHNKGIMNGIDAVAIATGNDWRGVEAGAHAYAAQSGRYRSLTRFWRKDGYLHGSIELPLAVATVGGSTGVHPLIPVLKKLLNVQGARQLAGVMAAVGLAQNFGALKALASEGIQRGHMSLHARSVALSAGANADEVDDIAHLLVSHQKVKEEYARLLLKQKRAQENEERIPS